VNTARAAAIRTRLITGLVWAGLILTAPAACSDDSDEIDDNSVSPAASAQASLVESLDTLSESLDFVPIVPKLLPEGLGWDAEVVASDSRRVIMRFFREREQGTADTVPTEMDIFEDFDPEGRLCVRCPEEEDDFTNIEIDGEPAQEQELWEADSLAYSVYFRNGDVFVTILTTWEGPNLNPDLLRPSVQEVAKSMLE